MSSLVTLPAGACAMSLGQRALERRQRSAGAEMVLSLRARLAPDVGVERVRSAFERAAACFEIFRTQLHHSELLRDPVLIDAPTPRACWEIEGGHSDTNADDRHLLVGGIVADLDGARYLRLHANPVFVDPQTLLMFVQRMNAVLDARPCVAENASFRTVVAWQTEVLQSPEAQAGVDYWERQWALAQAPVRLPWFRQSGPSLRQRRGSRTALLDAELIERIERLAARRGVRVELVLLMGWLRLLAQMSDTDALPFYWLRDERTMDDFVSTGGPLTKSLPFVIERLRGADFAAVLDRCQALDADAEEWGICCDPTDRRVDSTPIEFAFHFERTAAGGSLVPEAFSFDVASVAAQLSALWAAGLVRLNLTFDAARLSEPFVELWLARLVALLDAGCDTTTPGPQVAVWPPAERQQVLAWSQTSHQDGGTVPMLERVRRHAETTPDEIALVTPTTTLTYASLWQMSGRVAAAIHRIGTATDRLVGLMCRESHVVVGAMLGVWRAGGTWLMLDASWPSSRIRQVVADNSVGVVIAPSEFLTTLPEGIAGKLAIQDVLDSEPTDGVTEVNADSPAYVLMTSGSTGTPKAIAVTHANLACYVDAIVPTAGLAECRRFLACTTLAADLAYSALFPALSLGRAAVIADEAIAREPEELASFAQRHGVDFCKTVPTHLLALTTSASGHQWLPRTLMTGGEALPAALVQRLRSGRPDLQLWNHYGPAETTIGVISGPVPTLEEQDTAALGRPLPGSTVYILNTFGAPAVVGEAGEIHIGGQQVGLGYWRQPAATAGRFVPDAFSRQPGARLYRTGDLGRWRPDGSIEFLGRVDRQVKIRGHRVELEEVERALLGHEYIDGAAVVAVAGADGHLQLRACVVSRDARADVAPADLRSFLEQRLPHAMLPAQFLFLPELPYTPNGKLDRVALAASTVSQVEAQVGEAPATDVERALADIWALLLRRDRINRDTNFFALGGDSILAIQLVGSAREHGFRLTARQVFDHPTLAALARVVQRASDEPLVDPEARSAPLSPIQRWFVERLPDPPEAYVQAVAFDVDDEIAGAVLDQAYRGLVAGHPMLCARFDLHGTEGAQSLPQNDAIVPIVRLFDHRALTATDAGVALREGLLQVRDELDVRSGKLFAMCYQRRTSPTPGSYGAESVSCGRLILIAHHLISDVVSLRTVVEDLLPRLRGESAEGRRETTSYLDWVQWLYRNADRIADDAARDWWQRQIADASSSPTSESSGCEVDVVWSPDLTARIRALAQGGVTVHSILLAAYACALCEWTRRTAVTIDVEGHGRHTGAANMDLSRTVGWFTTLYPVHVRVHGDARDTVDGVSRACRAVSDGGLAYSVLRYVLGTVSEQRRWRSPAWARFNYLGIVDPNDQHAGFTLADDSFTWLRGASASIGGYTSALSARITGDVLHLTLEHPGGEIAVFAERLRRAVEETVTEIERALRDDEGELSAALEALESGE